MPARQTLLLNINADCVCERDAPIARFRRLRPLKSHVNCALPPIVPEASIQVSFWKKNWAQSSVLLLQIIADCARRTDVRTLFRLENYIYRLETLIIISTRSTLRPDPLLPLRQSFARLLRIFMLHPVSLFVWVRPAFRSRVVYLIINTSFDIKLKYRLFIIIWKKWKFGDNARQAKKYFSNNNP